jgi:hypothetical protein
LSQQISIMPTERPPVSPRLILALIMGGMVVWGAYVALGAYLYNYNPWRGLIVMACVGLFLGFWLLMLWLQGRAKKP